MLNQVRSQHTPEDQLKLPLQSSKPPSAIHAKTPALILVSNNNSQFNSASHLVINLVNRHVELHLLPLTIKLTINKTTISSLAPTTTNNQELSQLTKELAKQLPQPTSHTETQMFRPEETFLNATHANLNVTRDAKLIRCHKLSAHHNAMLNVSQLVRQRLQSFNPSNKFS